MCLPPCDLIPHPKKEKKKKKRRPIQGTMRMMLRVNHYSIKYKHLFHTLTKIFSTAPPGLVAQVVPGSSSNLKLGGSIPRINNYPAKKKKKKKSSPRLYYTNSLLIS